MKLDRFLIITVGALLAIIVILWAMGGAAFLCLLVTQGPVSNEGSLLEKNYDFNGSLGGYDSVDLQVGNINGFVNVREGDSDTYAIFVNTTGTGLDHERHKVEFTQSEVAGIKVLKLEVRDLKEPRVSRPRYVSDVTVILPKNKTYDMELLTVNGRVTLGNFTCGRVRMATVNSALSSRASAANATYASVNGPIDVSTTAVSGEIFASTVNGGITVSVPRGAPLSINAHVVNGGISSEVPIETSVKGPMSLVGKSANFTGGIYVEAATVNGGIDIMAH